MEVVCPFKSHFCIRLNYEVYQYNVASSNRDTLVVMSFDKCFPKPNINAFQNSGFFIPSLHKLK